MVLNDFPGPMIENNIIHLAKHPMLVVSHAQDLKWLKTVKRKMVKERSRSEITPSDRDILEIVWKLQT
jgi:hypothetical protein